LPAQRPWLGRRFATRPLTIRRAGINSARALALFLGPAPPASDWNLINWSSQRPSYSRYGAKSWPITERWSATARSLIEPTASVGILDRPARREAACSAGIIQAEQQKLTSRSRRYDRRWLELFSVARVELETGRVRGHCTDHDLTGGWPYRELGRGASIG
jgi:hypothetical protein